MEKRDYYEVLGVSKDASQDEIKSAFRKLAKKYQLRPGMGLAAPQLGINKRFFVVCYERSEGTWMYQSCSEYGMGSKAT